MPIVQEAKAQGYRVFVADKNPHCLAAPLAEKLLPSLGPSDQDITNLLNELQPFGKELAMCLTVGTDFSLPMAFINQEFHLRGVQPTHARVTTHKGNMRKFLRAYGFLQPDFFITDNLQQAVQWLENKPLPTGYVIKPVLNMGARGVMFFKDKNELPFAFEYAARYSHTREVIIEEFIEAHEFSIDALVIKGKVYECGFADRIIERKDGRFFIENGHNMPSVYPQEIKEAVTTELQKFADALFDHSKILLHGALKGDIRFTAQKKIIIGEIASRLSGGFMSTHTYPLATGNSLMQGMIEVLQGKTPAFIKKKKNSIYKKYVIERSLYAQAGTINVLKVLPMAKDHPNLKYYHLNYKENDVLVDLQNNVGKVGHFVVEGDNLQTSENHWQEIRRHVLLATSIHPLAWSQLRVAAKEKMNSNFCTVCKICDGEHCASSVPGMGAVGRMDGFKNNLYSLRSLQILPRYLKEEKAETNFFVENSDSNRKPSAFCADTSFELAGKRYDFPLTNAPITGAFTNMGGSISEWELALESAAAMRSLNLLPFFGDGADDNKFYTALAVISLLESGVPFFKPRKNQKNIARRIELAEKAKADAWGIDIDSVALATMKNKNVAMERKSLQDLRELKAASSLPFLVKGVLSIEDARLAAEAGAAAIVVSNHGGRIVDSLPPSAQVLPSIALYLKKNFPQVKIFADGGVRSGADIFKLMALGADAVSVGRPLAIAIGGGGRAMCAALVKHYQEEFFSLLQINGIKNLQQLRGQKQWLWFNQGGVGD